MMYVHHCNGIKEYRDIQIRPLFTPVTFVWFSPRTITPNLSSSNSLFRRLFRLLHYCVVSAEKDKLSVLKPNVAPLIHGLGILNTSTSFKMIFHSTCFDLAFHFLMLVQGTVHLDGNILTSVQLLYIKLAGGHNRKNCLNLRTHHCHIGSSCYL